LHDVKRNKAAVYDGKNVFLAPLTEADVLLSANEERWQALWKWYYAAVNIPSRERLRQMRGFMPKRYWKFLPELHNPFID
jgi:probable DNA metabolism protein